MARIALADHPVAVRGIRDILRSERKLSVDGHASRPEEVLKLLRQKPFNLLVYEIQIAGVPDGLRLLERIRTQFPKTGVLVYTLNPQRDLGVRALKTGASGFLHKESPEEELLVAVRKILAGDRYLPSRLEHQLALLQLERTTRAAGASTLSNRELEVLKGIVEGEKIKEIAVRLSLSPKTVTAYRSRVLRKMGMRSNAELVHFVEQNPDFI
jgi:two-component system, NarL family, invasion response regulator UvrY